MKKALIVLLFLITQQGVVFCQINKYLIAHDSKGKYTLTHKSSNTVRFSKCTSIDSITVALPETDPGYKNFLIIKAGKKTTLFNTKNDSIVFSAECDKLDIEELHDHYPDSVLPLKTVIKLYIVKEGKSSLGMLLNVKTGKVIALSNYSDSFNHDRSLVKLFKGGFYSEVLDLNGKVIVPRAEILSDLKKAFVVRRGESFSVDGRCGVINTKGETIVPFIYRDLEFVADRYFIVYDTLHKVGVIDLNNRIIAPFDHVANTYIDSWSRKLYPTHLYSNYGVFVLLKSKQKGDFVIVDTNSTMLVKAGTYNEITSMNDKDSNRFFEVTCPNGLKGVYDAKTKKEIFPCAYTSLSSSLSLNNVTHLLIMGLKEAEKDGKWGLLDLQNVKVLVPFEYDINNIKFVKDKNPSYFQLQKNGKKGLIAVTGQELIPFIYDDITPSAKGFFIVKKNGLYGLVDGRTFKEVLASEFSKISYGYKEGTNTFLLEKIDGPLLKTGFLKDGEIKWE